MSTGKKYSKMLFPVLLLLLVVFVAGCGSSHNNNVAPNSAKAITAFSLNGASGVINEPAKTIAVTVPHTTNVTALVATFATTGASVKVGLVTQQSGTTPNNFTSSVIYTVTATDGTTVNYTVTVTVALATDKSITSYTIAGQATSTIIGSAITVTMPFSTPTVTAGIATFSSSGAFVTVGTTTPIVQTSGTTTNNFTGPVAYTVHAADGSTATYTVTVTNALNSAKAITAYSIASEVSHTIIASAITVTMPFGTVVSNLTASFTTTGAFVTVGTTTPIVQTSGTTTNNFTGPVTYTVHAADASSPTYTVTVALAAPSAAPAICTGTTGTTGNACVDLGAAANYVILANAAITNVPISAVTGSIGVYPTTGAAIGITCGEVTGTIFSADAAGPACKVTDATGLNLGVNAKSAAYTDGFGRTETSGAYLNIGTPAGTLDASVSPLVPGVYVWTSGITIPVNLTLNGSATDVWILKVGGAINLGARVFLTGGALPQNVFWVSSGAVTVAAGQHMEGVVLSAGDITLITGASANGRLLSATQVVLQVATVTEP